MGAVTSSDLQRFSSWLGPSCAAQLKIATKGSSAKQCKSMQKYEKDYSDLKVDGSES